MSQPKINDRPGEYSPYTKRLGIDVVEAGGGLSRCVMRTDEGFWNMQGLVHGGAAFSLLDTALGAALHGQLGEAEGAVTLEVQIHYMKAFKEGLFEAEGRIIKRGRRVIFLEGEVTCNGEVVARGTGTYAVTQRR